MYISLLDFLQLSGLNILCREKYDFTLPSKALKSPPWKILQTKLPPGTSTRQPVSRAAWHNSKERAASISFLPVVAGAIKALALVDEEPALRERLAANTARFREGLEKLGFELLPGEHPIVPVMLHDAALAARFADEMLKLGVYVVAFSYPVVPRGKARIRTQMSAALSDDAIDRALAAFARTRRTLGLS